MRSALAQTAAQRRYTAAVWIEWLSQVALTYQGYAGLAFAVTVFATPLAAALARRIGVMDVPDTRLKPHARPIPYLGGAAICLGWAAALLAALAAGKASAALLTPILLGGLAMSTLGLIDDARHLSPRIRLLCGAVIIGLVLTLTGTGAKLVSSVTTTLGIPLPEALETALSIVIGVVIVLGACNSTNLIDGLDGLCTGVTAIIALGFFLLAAHLASYRPQDPGHAIRLVMAVALFGATLGFLPFNFNPARIFMGDAGSILLGYNCGVLILLFAEWNTLRWVFGALVVFALPVCDTLLAMLRRWRSGRSIFEGDRSHFYDQLVQRGFTVRQTVLISYALSLVFAALGLLVLWMRTRYALVVFVSVFACVAYSAWAIGLTNPDRREKPMQL